MQILYFERLGAIIGIAAVLSDTRDRTIARPLNIVSTTLSIVVYLHTGLYASLLLDVMFVFLDFYGVYYYLYRKQIAVPLKPTRASGSLLGGVLVVGLVSSSLLGFLLNKYFNAELAYMDSLNACFALLAYWMLMRRKLEGWIIAGLFDAYYAGICYYEHLYGFFVEQIVISLLALYGYWSWRKAYYGNKEVPSVYPQHFASCPVAVNSEDETTESPALNTADPSAYKSP